MLGQIERGESNPTVVTLWKIAGGLQVPFTTFIEGEPEPDVAVIPKNRQPVVEDDGGRYVVQSLFTIRSSEITELFRAVLQPHSRHAADAHGTNVREGIWVRQGTLKLELSDRVYELREGDSAHFAANVPHVYVNDHPQICEFIISLIYAPLDSIQAP